MQPTMPPINDGNSKVTKDNAKTGIITDDNARSTNRKFFRITEKGQRIVSTRTGNMRYAQMVRQTPLLNEISTYSSSVNPILPKPNQIGVPVTKMQN